MMAMLALFVAAERVNAARVLPRSVGVVPPPLTRKMPPVAKSLAAYHSSLVSFQIKSTSVLLPRLIVMPAFSLGAALLATSLFSVILLSPILRLVLFTLVVVPVTVRLGMVMPLLVAVSAVVPSRLRVSVSLLASISELPSSLLTSL